jgi:hypothetical protein
MQNDVSTSRLTVIVIAVIVIALLVIALSPGLRQPESEP